MVFKLSSQNLPNPRVFLVVVYGKSKKEMCVCVMSVIQIPLCRTGKTQGLVLASCARNQHFPAPGTAAPGARALPVILTNAQFNRRPSGSRGRDQGQTGASSRSALNFATEADDGPLIPGMEV